MSITANLTTNVETITATIVVEDETIIGEINTAARGPTGPAGAAGSNSITSATTSDGTANLSLSNVTTATATVSSTLTAPHIHGNLAGSVYAHIRAGETLAKGDPVYVSGSHGSGADLIPIVSKADSSNAGKMPAVGIMDAAVANNASGHMVIVGTITELNTAAYTVNAELYVAAGGGFTATPPTARAQPVARVERANANNGAVIVKVNGLSASDATASTLVRRDANGDAVFGALNTSGLTVTGGTTFGEESLVQFDAIEYYYDTGAASAHRIALGAGTTGTALFGAATAAAARTTLGLATSDSPTFAQITVGAGSRISNSGGIKFGGEFDLVSLATNSDFGLTRSNIARIVLGQSGVGMRQEGAVSWTGTTEATDAKDLSLLRDAANTLAQRNGTAAQTSRIYDTYASATDYHRLAIATARATATAMSGPSVTLTNIIPAGAVVVGVTCKVTTAITGATSFDIGTATDVDRFGAAVGIALGATSDNRNWTSGAVECFPAATSLILTANGGNFTAGAVYVSVQYLSGQAD